MQRALRRGAADAGKCLILLGESADFAALGLWAYSASTPHNSCPIVVSYQGKNMQQHTIKIEHQHALIEKLAGSVFHVTQMASLESILASGSLLPNLENSRQSPFGNSGNGFFRSMGCVSFFDYRRYGSPEWEEHAHKCMPTLAFRKSHSIAILFLSESEHAKLIPWSLWKETESWSQRVVPHVETGYRGEVPLALITKMLLVECSGS